MTAKITQLISKVYFFFLFVSLISYSQDTEIYNITFTSVWNASDHGTLPGGAHWSPLAGATHNTANEFLMMGSMATLGIEDVAETGNTDDFESEVNAVIGLSRADQWLRESVSSGPLGSATLSNVTVHKDFSLLTLASMIAPSPDWLIAINSIDLRDGGTWKSSITIDVFPYDAGTEEGTAYSTSNSATTPQENITSLVNVAPFNNQKIGTITITRANLGTNNLSFNSKVKIYPNPSNNGIISLDNKSNRTIKSIEIYDLNGNIIKEITNNISRFKSPISVNRLSSGMYFTKILSTDGFATTKKLIINNR